ncbi:class I SAM-dependent methyltransferase [Streptomyces pimonensis]|uniref:Class I SAM-dependent methyltransferase n=1 Tax=Streptomyces pimonensis TaxID=2860288 RepID=A0ABV4J6K1_9ACTN
MTPTLERHSMNSGADRNLFDTADVYEAIYRGRGKDYTAEAARVVSLVRASVPDATSLLDVACGPASHLVHFADHFDHVEGLDLSEDMLRVAKQRLPGTATLHHGDMRDFRIDARFSAVTCMFSSISYARTRAELDSALRCMADHLLPTGTVVVEPWWFPEDFTPDHVAGDVVTVDGRTISRVSHSVREADATRMDVHYLVATPGKGIEHFADTHRMTLFARADYEAAFTGAGLSVCYEPDPAGGPGLFIGTRTVAA